MFGKLLTEFIGTFFLVLTIGLTVTTSNTLMAPIAIGAILMVMVYMGGHVSGAHYNPAVTVAVALRGKCSWGEVIPYWISQIVGSLAAAYVVHMLVGRPFLLKPQADLDVSFAVMVEVFFTFALALVVLNTATASRTANNSFYGLAIGFTVTAAAYAGGAFSGGAFNPAVGIGPNVIAFLTSTPAEGAESPLSSIWIYIVGPIVGAAVAAGVFKVQNPDG